MGLQGEDWKQNKDTLLEAVAKSGVKVYIPSEFGTNHEITNYADNATFAPKAHHFHDAVAKIPKVVGIYTSLMMEQTFIKWLGFDNDKEVWEIVGKGDVPVSITSRDDVGRFTVEAAIMAFQEPDKVPQKCQIHTVTMTLQQYANVLDKYSETGNKLKLQGKTLEQAKADWEETKHTIPVGMVPYKFAKETNCSLDLCCRLLWRRDILIIPRIVQMRFLILEKVNGNLLPLKSTQSQ